MPLMALIFICSVKQFVDKMVITKSKLFDREKRDLLLHLSLAIGSVNFQIASCFQLHKWMFVLP